MRPRFLTVTIEGLSEDGFGYARHNENEVFVVGGLPGEEVYTRVFKKRAGKRWVVVEQVLSPSPDRIQPMEDHFLSCSPWAIMPYTKQIEYKKHLLEQLYKQYSVAVDGFFGAVEEYGYRTKAEFGFWYDNGAMYLGYHTRGKPFVLTPLSQGCALLSSKSNKAALAIIELINKHQIPKAELKSLTIRESKTKDKRIALLCVKKEDFSIPFGLKDIPELDGLVVAFSNPLSPASVLTNILSVEGDDFLEETISQVELRYPIDGFFQNNIPLFEKVLEIMGNVVKSQSNSPKTAVSKMVELYSGVGTIGLALHKHSKEIIGVEVVPSSIRLAKENALRNNIKNYSCFDIAAEKMDSTVLADADVVILDPPRIGLHEDVVNYLLTYKPKTILYLSCNPITQARDFAQLQTHYSPTYLYGFDFYPQTNHMESLLVLSLKRDVT